MPRKHWAAEEKIRMVLESLNTSIGVAELCRKYAVNPVVFYAWKEKFIEGGKQALTRSRRNGGEGEFQAENGRLKQLIMEKKSEEWLELALKSKNLEKKLEYCTKYLESNPNSVDVWGYKADLLFILGREDEVGNCYRKAYEKVIEEAILCCNEALGIDPNDDIAKNVKEMAGKELQNKNTCSKNYSVDEDLCREEYVTPAVKKRMCLEERHARMGILYVPIVFMEDFSDQLEQRARYVGSH